MEELRKEEKVGVEYEKEEEKKLIEGVAVLDFDVLCSTVAMQSQGKWRLFENEVEDDEKSVVGNGVLRMWEGEVLDCFDDHRVAFQSFCFCFPQLHSLHNYQETLFPLCGLSIHDLCRNIFGLFPNSDEKKFNIKGTDSSLDDCVYHLVCPCCTISQESRTLEMNNVQGGTWHGRGDTLCVGTFGEGASVCRITSSVCSINSVTRRA